VKLRRRPPPSVNCDYQPGEALVHVTAKEVIHPRIEDIPGGLRPRTRRLGDKLGSKAPMQAAPDDRGRGSVFLATNARQYISTEPETGLGLFKVEAQPSDKLVKASFVGLCHVIP